LSYHSSGGEDDNDSSMAPKRPKSMLYTKTYLCMSLNLLERVRGKEQRILW
jgi:hypothetical protein